MSNTITVNLIGSEGEKSAFMEAIFDTLESYMHAVAVNSEAILRFAKVGGVATIILDKIILKCSESIIFDDVEVALTKAFSAQINTELSEHDSYKLGSCGYTSEGVFLELTKR
jgi:hypothetical protein